MSRHEVPALDPLNTVIVGWDHPLRTFFAQVKSKLLEKTNPDDPFLLWIGCSLREIYEIEDLAHALRQYAFLDANIRTKLYGDKDAGL